MYRGAMGWLARRIFAAFVPTRREAAPSPARSPGTGNLRSCTASTQCDRSRKDNYTTEKTYAIEVIAIQRHVTISYHCKLNIRFFVRLLK
jgi:hypothetical protein